MSVSLSVCLLPEPLSHPASSLSPPWLQHFLHNSACFIFIIGWITEEEMYLVTCDTTTRIFHLSYNYSWWHIVLNNHQYEYSHSYQTRKLGVSIFTSRGSDQRSLMRVAELSKKWRLFALLSIKGAHFSQNLWLLGINSSHTTDICIGKRDFQEILIKQSYHNLL